MESFNLMTKYEDEVGGLIEPVEDMFDRDKESEDINKISAEMEISIKLNSSSHYSTAI